MKSRKERQAVAGPSQAPAKKKRILYMTTALVVLVVVAVLNRSWLASFPNGQARRCLAQRDAENAFWWLRISQRIAPKNAEYRFLLARVLRRKGETDAAFDRQLEEARDAGWPNERVEAEKCLAMAQNGHMRETFPFLSLLLKEMPLDAAEVYEAFTIGALRNFEYKIANDLAVDWIDVCPEDPLPHFMIGQMMDDTKQLDRAEPQYRAALELDPAYHAAALALADLLAIRSNYSQALEFYHHAADGQTERLLALVGEANCLRHLGRTNEAKTLLAKVIADDAEMPTANLELAQLDIAEGNFEQALGRLEPLAAKVPRNTDVQLALANVLNIVGRSDEAREQLKAATNAKSELSRIQGLMVAVWTDPGDPECRHKLGRIYLNFGSQSKGLDWLHKVVSLDPNYKPTLCLLADYYESMHDDKSSTKALAREFRTRCQNAVSQTTNEDAAAKMEGNPNAPPQTQVP